MPETMQIITYSEALQDDNCYYIWAYNDETVVPKDELLEAIEYHFTNVMAEDTRQQVKAYLEAETFQLYKTEPDYPKYFDHASMYEQIVERFHNQLYDEGFEDVERSEIDDALQFADPTIEHLCHCLNLLVKKKGAWGMLAEYNKAVKLSDEEIQRILNQIDFDDGD